MVKCPVPSEDILNTLDHIFEGNTDVYVQKPEQFVSDVYERMLAEGEFVCLNFEDSSVAQLVTARCMVQDCRGTEYVSTMCAVTEGEGESAVIHKKTMLFRDALNIGDGELTDCDGNVGRHCYAMVDIPGATDWFIAEQAMPLVDGIPEKRARYDEQGRMRRSLPTFIAKFVCDDAQEIPPNTVIDLVGLLLPHHNLLETDGEESTNILNVPNIHVMKYAIVPSVAKEPAAVDNVAMTDRSCDLQGAFVELMGDANSAEWVRTFLVSSTYARPSGMPIAAVPLNIVGVTNSSPIVDILNALMPKVKLLTLTPELLSDSSFAPVKDYATDGLKQGELQLANGTLLVIDETKLPEGSFPVSNYAESNLQVLEQLVVDQRILYDYGFYKLPFDVDVPVLVLSKGISRFIKTPYRVPIVPGGKQMSSFLNDGEKMKTFRKYIQDCRQSLKHITISMETSQTIQDHFVEKCKKVAKDTDKAQLMHELLIVARLLATQMGSREVEFCHWEFAWNMLDDSKKNMAEWIEMMRTRTPA